MLRNLEICYIQIRGNMEEIGYDVLLSDGTAIIINTIMAYDRK